MNRSSTYKTVPVRLGRYRYSKWRWRLSVHALDALGLIAMRVWRSFRPIPRWEAPRRILLVQLDHLGDAVLTSPLLERLHEAHPGTVIDVLASPSNREVFETDARVRRVIVAERNWFERGRGHWALGSAVWELGRGLRGAGYDLGIDVRGDVLTVFVLALAGVPRRLGWAMGGGGFLLTDVAEWAPGRHEVASRLALLEAVGIATEGPARVSVPVTDRDRVQVAAWLRQDWPERRRKSARRVARVSSLRSSIIRANRSVDDDAPRDDADALHAGRFGAPSPLLAVHLGAGTAAKRWPSAHWRALVARFLGEGWRVVVLGGIDDVATARRLEPHPELRDWTAQLSVAQTAALLERADLFVGADSAPAHLAACAGVPSVVLFSGTNRKGQWRPWSRRSLVLRASVPCRPCHQKVCPLADHPCLTGLTPDRVYRAARRWWARMHQEESPHAPL